jgi:hypothetical protein
MWISCLLFLSVFEIYLRTHCASFNVNDSGETILACSRLAVSHSPGYPLHMLWGNVFTQLFPFGQPMLRVTLASMATASLSVVLFYNVLKHVLDELWLHVDGGVESGGEWKTAASAWAASWWFAFSYQAWFQAGGAKGGIYTLNTLGLLAVTFLLVHISHRGRAFRFLLLSAFLFGLGLSNHWPSLVVLAPVFLWIGCSFQTYWTGGVLKSELFCKKTILIFSVFFLVAVVVFLGADETSGVSASPVLNLMLSLGKAFVWGLAPVALWILTRMLGGAFIARLVSGFLLGLTPYLALSIRSSQHPVVDWWSPDRAIRLWETVIRKGYDYLGDARTSETMYRNIKRFGYDLSDQYGIGFSWGIVLLAVY